MRHIAKKIHKNRDEILNFCARHKKIYIYGAGMISSFMINYLQEEEISIAGVLVSENERRNNFYKGYEVKEICEHIFSESDGIIIAVGVKYQNQIVKNLMTLGVLEKQIYCQSIYLSVINGHELHYARMDAGDMDSAQHSYFSKFHELESLGKYFGTDKCSDTHNYLNKYEMFLQKWKNEKINVLELGVFDGASIEMWEKYFLNAMIYGVDIDERCKKYEGGRKKVVIQDLNDEDGIDQLSYIRPTIIIDDASHIRTHQIKALWHLLPIMQPGGVFIMEDLGTNYDKYRNMIYNDSDVSCADFCLAISDVVLSGEFVKTSKTKPELVPLKEEIEFLAKQIEMAIFINESCLFIKK